MNIEIDFGSLLDDFSSLEERLPNRLTECADEIAEQQTQIIKDTFGSSLLKANAESTIGLKGENSPLVETGSMRDSIYPQTDGSGVSVSALAKSDDWRLFYHALGYTTSPKSAFPLASVPSRDPVTVRMTEIQQMAIEKVEEAIENLL